MPTKSESGFQVVSDVSSDDGQPKMALVTKLENGSGFCQDENGQSYYFGLPGYVAPNGRGGYEKARLGFRLEANMVIGMVKVVRFHDQPRPAAWNWTHVSAKHAGEFKALLAEKPAQTPVIAADASATAKPGKVLWHVHATVADELNMAEHGWGSVALIGDSRPFDRIAWKDGELLGFNAQGYSHFNGLTYELAMQSQLPKKGDHVVVLNTRRRTAKKPNGETVETDEVIAWRWCLASDFPSGLCTEHCHCDHSATEAILGQTDEVKPGPAAKRVSGQQFRIVLGQEFGGKVYTMAPIADISELVDTLTIKPGQTNEELAIACGEFCLERKIGDDQWEAVTETMEQLLAQELRKALSAQSTPTAPVTVTA